VRLARVFASLQHMCTEVGATPPTQTSLWTSWPSMTRTRRSPTVGQPVGTRVKTGEAVKELAARALCMAGVPALARKQMRGSLAILMYHGVEPNPLSPPCPYVIEAATMRSQLEFLSRHFHVLPLEEALQRLRSGTLPDRAAALTFDDGARNIATHAAPILRDLGLPAAVFLATGPMGTGEALWPDRLWISFSKTNLTEIDLAPVGLGVFPLGSPGERGIAWSAATAHFKELPDEQRLARVEWLVATLGPEFDAYGGPFELLSWDEARGLASDGLVSLHPHSVTHPILSRCPDEKVEYEISESCAAVERETGHAPAIFAYPNGRPEDFDERARKALRRNDIRWALSASRGFAHRDSDPFALPRIGISGNISSARFQVHISSTPPWRRTGPTATNEGQPQRASMKGLFYCDWFKEYTAGLALSVAESHEVTLIAREPSAEFRQRRADEAQLHRDLTQSGVELHLLSGKYRSIRGLVEIYKISKRRSVNRYDYFHIQQTPDPRFLWVAFRMPTVYTIHEPASRRGLEERLSFRNLSDIFIRRLYRYLADVIIVHTQNGLESLPSRNARKAVVIPHGVQISDTELPTSSKTILFFGRTVAYKGLDTLLAAMTEVWKVEPQARLQILASPGDTECRYEISDSRISASWDGYSKTDLELALSNARAVCLPYTSASGSGVGAQAYGAGKPIVASNLEGLRELVAHKELLVRPGDADDLARALIWVLRHDYGVQEIDTDRTWPKIALAHIATYQSMVPHAARQLQSKS
jgi:glycosyltransferase involved in cell wall biosynthesis/peptidoglycan/xylan/chitin deacetylase (PgdA/CDA1 family)